MQTECRHFRVTVVTSSRRRPPCWAVSCRASLGIQHVQLVQCRVVLGHRNATSVPCPCPRAAPSWVFRAVTIAMCRAAHGHRNATSAPCPRRARARLPCHLRSLAGALEKGPIIEGVRGSIWRGRTHEICTAEFRHLRVTVLTSGRRRPPRRAVSCRAALGLQHVQLVPCRVVLGHRNATTVPCPCPCAAPCRARF